MGRTLKATLNEACKEVGINQGLITHAQINYRPAALLDRVVLSLGMACFDSSLGAFFIKPAAIFRSFCSAASSSARDSFKRATASFAPRRCARVIAIR